MKLPKYRKLTIEKIFGSNEIESWLSQFDENEKNVAIELLSRLRFISYEDFFDWMKYQVNTTFGSREHVALYAVRKTSKETTSLWNERKMVSRPASSLGSEDFVASLISRLVKEKKNVYLDHPSIETLRSERVKHIVFIDDSSGSGDRISIFLKKFFQNKSVLSWWSGGRMIVHIFTYSITENARKKILGAIPGSDHPVRKFPKKDKVHFHTGMAFDVSRMQDIWGEDYRDIVELCENVVQIPKQYRKGYDSTMSNVVFYHSVPNNIPGLLWCQREDWNALFPGRVLPDWTIELLQKDLVDDEKTMKSEVFFNLLAYIKRGVRRKESLSVRLGIGADTVERLMSLARKLGLVNEKGRITRVGVDFLKSGAKPTVDHLCFDYSLYIPIKYEYGRFSVQPSLLRRSKPQAMTNLSGFDSRGGDVVEASLERSDAKTTSSSNNVVLHSPSESRMDHDVIGPSDSKES